jgi:uncharacterized membrane protein
MPTLPNTTGNSPLAPFRRAVWRGLGVVMPPLLTIVIFLWVGQTVQQYVLAPVEWMARESIVWGIKDIRYNLVDTDPQTPEVQTTEGDYAQVGQQSYVPLEVMATLRQELPQRAIPDDPLEAYRRYVELTYLKPLVVIPLFLSVFVLVLYLLGKFLAIGIGRFFWGLFERGIGSLPLVRNVYSSVKQVTDLMFNEHELEYTRIVAVEFPSKGIWSIGFVTGESLNDIRAAANEPVLAVLIPYSPLPITGATITVRKSETIDLNITVDQAFQFVVSCGVVVPPHQMFSRTKQPPLIAGDNGAARQASSAQGGSTQIESKPAGSPAASQN